MDTVKQNTNPAPSELPQDTAQAIARVNDVLRAGVESRASDIHFEWVNDRLRVRFRVDGVLRDHANEPFAREEGQQVVARVKAMAGMNTAETRLPQDGRAMMRVGGEELDMRVSCVPYVVGECLTCRLLRRGGVVLSLERQGFTPEQKACFRGWISRPHGLVVLTGPTGSGKTTTLYSALGELNRGEIKITTIEDPVEYIIPGINQQQILPARGLTMAAAMRAQLRQDPDVIMLGEVRDTESVQIAVQAGLTGHLVLTQLHADTAPGAVRRLLDIGLDPYLLNGVLIGAMAQRLVRIVCPDCRQPHEPDAAQRAALGDLKGRFVRGAGCERCRGTGYRGRIAIHELLEQDDGLRRLIAKDAELDELAAYAAAAGVASLRQDGLAKAAAGETTLEEVLRVCAV